MLFFNLIPNKYLAINIIGVMLQCNINYNLIQHQAL